MFSFFRRTSGPKEPAAHMDEATEVRLVDELLEVLDSVVERSGCADMWPLWLMDTLDIRRQLLRWHAEPVDFEVPQSIARWKAPKRSKWASLAAWRHAVLWFEVLSGIQPDRERQAIEDMYFTPAPGNAPPYAWTKRSSDAPGAHRYASVTVFRDAARRGCEKSLNALREQGRRPTGPGDTVERLARATFAENASRKTLHDVLRLSNQPPKGEPR